MSLENEYFEFKSQLKSEMELFKKFQDQDITKMSEDQLKAHDRGLKSLEKSIEETDKVIDEIKVELYDFIYNDGEVSKKTIETLSTDLHQDIFFKSNELDEYDMEVLHEKVNFLNSLL